MKKIIIASAVLLAFPAAAQAQDCYTVEKGDTSEISNNLQVSLEEIFQQDGQSFTINPEDFELPQQQEEQENGKDNTEEQSGNEAEENENSSGDNNASEEPSAKQPAEQAEPEPSTEEPAEETTEETDAQPSEEANAEEETSDDAETQSESEFEQRVIELTNQEREQAGLEPLKPYSELSDVARDKSEDMRDAGYFSHNSPNYGSPFDMMDTYNIEYQGAGENIAAGQRSPEQVVEGWMNSEGHRENILNGDFTHIGVGHAEGGSYGNYWTQMFVTK
ncbi:CAP domain-containing protein [Salibacterium aidingense]|uniref:CAP domain-containing protein n=1 Tax=Salibacterium aidingense TaxID=384933 RepID=UPI003BE62BEA